MVSSSSWIPIFVKDLFSRYFLELVLPSLKNKRNLNFLQRYNAKVNKVLSIPCNRSWTLTWILISLSAKKNLIPGKIFKLWLLLRLICKLFNSFSARVNSFDDVISQIILQTKNLVPFMSSNLQWICIIDWNIHIRNLQIFFQRNRRCIPNDYIYWIYT